MKRQLLFLAALLLLVQCLPLLCIPAAAAQVSPAAPIELTESTNPGEPTELTGPGEPVEQTEPDEPAAPDPDFEDITGHWAENAIRRAKELGLMAGVSSTAFAPNEEMTRAMFVTVLYRFCGLFSTPAVPKPSAFKDVPRDTWYTESVDWAAEKGVVSGVSTDCFAPNGFCTREQAVTILRAFVLTLGRTVDEKADLSRFADLTELAPYARGPMRWAVGAGLISGIADDLLAPKGYTTRAQLAVIVCCLYDYLCGELTPPNPPPALPALTKKQTVLYLPSAKTLACYTAGNTDYLRLEDLRAALGGTITPDLNEFCPSVTLKAGTRTAFFTDGFPLIGIGGRTLRLAGPVRQEADGWYVPVETAALWYDLPLRKDPLLDRLYLWKSFPCSEKVYYNTAVLTGVRAAMGQRCLSPAELAALTDGSVGAAATESGIKTAVFTLCGHTLKLYDGSAKLRLDGKSVILNVPVVLEGSVWRLPASVLTETLGHTAWAAPDGKTCGYLLHAKSATVVWLNGGRSPACWSACGVRYIAAADVVTAAGAGLGTAGDTATLTLFGHSLKLQEGFAQQLDGKAITLPTPVYRVGGAWYLPLAEMMTRVGLTELMDKSWNQVFYTKIVRNADIPKGYKVPVLMYHAVSDDLWGVEELFVSPKNMEAQLKALLAAGCTPITFEDLDRVNTITKPVMLTFDDGYKDNYTELFPLLKKYNVKVTIFMITGAVGNNRSLTAEQIKEMQASGLVSFQSHTVTHANMDELTEAQLETETYGSMMALARITGKQPFALCYPSGKNNALSRKITAKYYQYGVCMSGARYVTGANPYQIYRYYISRTTSIGTFTWYIS